jgi:hypothetical protein
MFNELQQQYANLSDDELLRLPARYRLPADWQEAAAYAMLNSVVVAVWFFRDWGRRSAFGFPC